MVTNYTGNEPQTHCVRGEKPDPTEPHITWFRSCEMFATGKGERASSRFVAVWGRGGDPGELAINGREGAELTRVGTPQGRRQQGKNKDQSLRCPKAMGLTKGTFMEVTRSRG